MKPNLFILSKKQLNQYKKLYPGKLPTTYRCSWERLKDRLKPLTIEEEMKQAMEDAIIYGDGSSA